MSNKEVFDVDDYVNSSNKPVNVSKELGKFDGVSGIKQKLLDHTDSSDKKKQTIFSNNPAINDALNTLTFLVTGKDNYRVTKKQIELIKANKQNYSSEDYNTKLQQLESLVDYRDDVLKFHRNGEELKRRRDKANSDPEVKKLSKELSELKTSFEKTKPFHIVRLYSNYFKRAVALKIVDDPFGNISDDVIDIDQLVGDTDKNKKFFVELNKHLETLKDEDIFSINVEDDKDIPLKEKFMNTIILISLIIDKDPITVFQTPIASKKAKKDAPEVKGILEQVKEKISNFRDDKILDRIKEMTLDLRLLKSKKLNDSLPRIIRQDFDLNTEKGISKSKELLAASQVKAIYAIAAYIIRSQGMDIQRNLDDVAGAGLLKLSEVIDEYIEIIKIEKYKDLSLSAYISDICLHTMKTAANQLRGIGTRNANSENYDIRAEDRLWIKFKKDIGDKMKAEGKTEDEIMFQYVKYVTKVSSNIAPDAIKRMSGSKTSSNNVDRIDKTFNSEEGPSNPGPVDRDLNPQEKMEKDDMLRIAKEHWLIFFNEIVNLPKLNFKGNGIVEKSSSKTYISKVAVEALKKKLGIIRNPNAEDGIWNSDGEIAKSISSKERGSGTGISLGTLSFMFGTSKNASILNSLSYGERSLVNDYKKMMGIDKGNAAKYRKYVEITEEICKFIDKFIRGEKGDNRKSNKAAALFLGDMLSDDLSDQE